MRNTVYFVAICLLISSSTVCFAQSSAPATTKDLSFPKSLDGMPGEGPLSASQAFPKLWLDRREKWAKEVDGDQGAVVFLGDSITQYWGDDLQGAFDDLKVANRGISGDTSRGVLIRLDDVLEVNPSGVVMLIGTNDLARGATPEIVADNVERILGALKERFPEMPIVVCAVFPSSAKMDRPKEKIMAINRLVAEAVEDDDQVTFVDTYSLFADESGDAKPEEFPDMLHPNTIGYSKWAAKLKPVLRERGLLNEEEASQ